MRKKPVKKLQKGSIYAEYDINKDGTVSDEELEHMRDIKKLEGELRKNRAQRRMATFTLIGMALFTAMMFMPFITIERIEALSDISNLFYISGAGIVGAYMGAAAWMSKK